MIEQVRVAGVLVAGAFAAYGIIRYRGGSMSRFDFLISLLIACGVGVVSIFPEIGDLLTGLFALQNRAFALLAFACLILFALLLRVIGQSREANRRGGRIVTALAAREYMKSGSSEQGGGVLVIVPAYNEEGGIVAVLRRVPKEILGRRVKVVVVNDGSTDETEGLALAEGVPVASHIINLGQGDALRTGFEIARLEEAEVVINLDADGQYRPEEIEPLVAPVLEDEADFVLGSRFLGYYEEAGSVRHIGVVFFSKMISLLTWTKITDCTNGFRAIRGSMLHRLDLREDRFNATEIILEGLKNKLRFKEIPVSMLKRAAGETKKPPKLRYPFGVFRVIIRTWLR